jgi:hypothetical protein
MLQGALELATVIAAVSPKLSAHDQGEIAAALLTFGPINAEKMYCHRRRSLPHAHAADLPRRIG